jgi:hypothetical protein
MFKWIWLILFLALGGLSIASALDDSGSSVADLFVYAVLVLALVFGIATFSSWRRAYRTNKSMLNRIGVMIPFLVIVTYLICLFITYRKINKPYILFATLPADHRYDYYFRTDSTLKIVGHFMLNDVQTFQKYGFQGDTVIIDTILPTTGLTLRKYVFAFSKDSLYQLLTPINTKGQKVDSLSLYIEKNNYR